MEFGIIFSGRVEEAENSWTQRESGRQQTARIHTVDGRNPWIGKKMMIHIMDGSWRLMIVHRHSAGFSKIPIPIVTYCESPHVGQEFETTQVFGFIPHIPHFESACSNLLLQFSGKGSHLRPKRIQKRGLDQLEMDGTSLLPIPNRNCWSLENWWISGFHWKKNLTDFRISFEPLRDLHKQQVLHLPWGAQGNSSQRFPVFQVHSNPRCNPSWEGYMIFMMATGNLTCISMKPLSKVPSQIPRCSKNTHKS